MMGAQRLARIRDAVQQHGFISVREIMDTFHISRSSAMRDLDELEKQGFLVRQRGGGVLKEKAQLLTPLNEQPVREKADIQFAAKQAICELAGSLIQDGQCIFVDGGTTVLGLVPYLEHKQVTVVTPNTYLMEQLPEHFPGRIYLTGGQWDSRYAMSFGPLARSVVEQFRFDMSFISCNGMEPAGDVSVFDFEVGEVKRAAMDKAAVKVLLADGSKFASRAMCVFAKMDMFDRIYTTQYPGEDIPGNVIVCESEEEDENN